MLRKIYLTIDDAPSIYMDKKVSFLREHNIPAIFYARGECIEKHPHQIIHAIHHGFLIGNHSYRHPYFSKTPLHQCFEEILKTEKLIDQCYRDSGKERLFKIIRLPFADRGAGPKAKEAVNEIEKIKVMELQSFLKKNDFKALNFQPINSYIDSYWDWDTEDYKSKHIQDSSLYINKMNDFFDHYTKDTTVILLHDFDHNHHLFDASMKFFLSRNVQFLDFC